MAFVSRLAGLREIVKANEGKNIVIITERSLYTDKENFAKMLYDSGKIEYINYQIYLSWFDTFSEEFPVHKIVYVKTCPEKCYSRVHKRSRDGEENIPLDYLINCSKYHNDMLDISSSECICNNQLILDGNIDIYENNEQLEKWISDIDNFIKQ
jgi:deoxyadenosine/deoxycytidine kinase